MSIKAILHKNTPLGLVTESFSYTDEEAEEFLKGIDLDSYEKEPDSRKLSGSKATYTKKVLNQFYNLIAIM